MKRAVAVCALVACTAKQRIAFHATDPMFRPAPGATPQVFTEANASDVPRVEMHSVGIIEVTARKAEREHAIEMAKAKGRELGCWILIEHAVFVRLGTSAWRDHGVTISKTHGGGAHMPGRGPKQEVVELDCVMQGASTTTSA